MYGALYACYSAACWPFNLVFCRRASPEELSPDESPDESSHFGAWEARKSTRSQLTDFSLPNLVPEIYIHAGWDDGDDDGVERETTGSVRINIQYSAQKKLIILTVVEASDNDENANSTAIQVRVAFLGVGSPRKHRTKTLVGPRAEFGQTFTLLVPEGDLPSTSIRLRLYRYKKAAAVRRGHFRGQCIFPASELDCEAGAPAKTLLLHFRRPVPSAAPSKKSSACSPSGSGSVFPTLPGSGANLVAGEGVAQPQLQYLSEVELEPTCNPNNSPISNNASGNDMLRRQTSAALPARPTTPLTSVTSSRRNSTVDSSGRFCALPTENGQPEALVSLCYLEQAQKVVVSVEKASKLGQEEEKCPDTFLRVSVLSQFGEELAKHRSTTIKGTSEPLYDSTAVFQVARNELENTSILIQVFRSVGVLRRRLQIGFVCLGENASSPDAQTHWEQMIQGMGTTVEKWHALGRTAIQ